MEQKGRGGRTWCKICSKSGFLFWHCLVVSISLDCFFDSPGREVSSYNWRLLFWRSMSHCSEQKSGLYFHKTSIFWSLATLCSKGSYHAKALNIKVNTALCHQKLKSVYFNLRIVAHSAKSNLLKYNFFMPVKHFIYFKYLPVNPVCHDLFVYLRYLNIKLLSLNCF